MSWAVEYRDGVWLPQAGWWLDARAPAERSFVSHAHFDHVADHREIVCSPGTARLLRDRLPADRVEHALPFGHPEALTGEISITLYPAGHIFGSAQCLLRHERHGALLYTGDFKLRPGRSAEPCATPPADVLIMETTYGRPEYVFPPAERVLADIAGFCRDALEEGVVPVLFGYSLGKSQELLRGLADGGLALMLHPQTARLTRVYEEFGVEFPPYAPFEAARAAGHVVLCPPHLAGTEWLERIRPRRTAAITGWAVDPRTPYRYRCDAAFPLSDHADYPDLLRMVERVRPARVLTLHGFAADFARDLRAKGIEAWALSEANQLDLRLPASAAAAPPVRVRAGAARREPRPAEDVSHFAAVADRIGAAAGKRDKVALLQAYLAALPAAEVGHAALFFTGRAFPASEGRALQLGWAVLKRALLDVAGATEEELGAAYHRLADAGDTAEALLQDRTEPQPAPLSELAVQFDALAAARGLEAKFDLLRSRLAELAPVEAKYLIKIMTGDLRIGLKEGLVEEAVAGASGAPLEAVRDAHLLCGDIRAVAVAAREHALGRIELTVFHPLQFMLASPEPGPEEILQRLAPPVWLEEKYDGIRCQIHRRGERVELFSRDLRRITGQFPDLARAALRLPGDFILDGEALAWRDGRALPFAELQKRLGRRGDDFFLGQEIPVSLSAYDLLWRDGRVLLREPLERRRRELEELLTSPAGGPRAPGLLLAPVRRAADAAEIGRAFAEARARGNEGLVAKDPLSPYTPGRRGFAWLKLKRAQATLDVVVVGAEYGHGRRRAVLSDVTFAVRDEDSDRLMTIGKAYTGLTDAEIEELTRHFLDRTLETRGRYHVVAPDVVLEVAFDAIQRSGRHEGGFALRFPRIARIRRDKGPREIDTLATCRRLAGLV